MGIMKNQTHLVFSLAFVCLLSSCGDVSSNRRMGQNRTPDRNTQEVGSEGSENLRSHIHREKGAKILSYAEEIQKILGRDLPEVSYRIIPLMERDDEGSDRNVRTVEQLGRPNSNCGRGDGFSGIDARITNCLQENGDRASWVGFSHGAAGESTWKLVLRDGHLSEIWLDGRTGMVWSYLRADSEGRTLVNWCKASGNDENESPGVSTDCNELAAGESLCAGAVFSGLGDQVKWRLPTRNDYLQADINGLRSVFPKEGTQGLWTATIRAGSEGRSEAWVYNTSEGTLSGAQLSSTHYVRCIGAPVR